MSDYKLEIRFYKPGKDCDKNLEDLSVEDQIKIGEEAFSYAVSLLYFVTKTEPYFDELDAESQNFYRVNVGNTIEGFMGLMNRSLCELGNKIKSAS